MKYIYLFLLLFSLQSHAETGTDCATPDVRCSAYDLDVNAEVLQNISFTQIQALNLGQVTKGEEVVVDTSKTEDNQERGRAQGKILLTFSSSQSEITIRCLEDQSFVNFDTESTKFSSCYMEANGIEGGIVNVDITPGGTSDTVTVPASTQDSDFTHAHLWIGGTITVPSNATLGEKTGALRIEAVYE